MANQNEKETSSKDKHSGLADQLVRLFGPDPKETPETNAMMLEALKGWRAQANDPKQTPNPHLREILVEQADEALRRVQELEKGTTNQNLKSSGSPDQT